MADGTAQARVLCVDDEENILLSIRRHQRKHFDLHTATDPKEALEAVRESGPFAVVVSDLRMPGMDGVELLKQVRSVSPDTTRIMLTGNADLEAAKRAVNDGHVFRFLTKPCPPEMLREAVVAGARIHELLVAERTLLEQTLRGAVDVLTQTLSLTNPQAFGRASRIRRYTKVLVHELSLPDPWKFEVAAMLSQIGAVAIPPDVTHKAYSGERLSPDEQRMIDDQPEVGSRLLSAIPRLEEVGEMVRLQNTPAQGEDGTEPPLGARILRLAIDYDRLRSRGIDSTEALQSLREAPEGAYDPGLLDVARALGLVDGEREERWVDVQGLHVGMLVADPVLTQDGLLIVSAGYEVTESLLERLHNWARSPTHGVRQPIRVLARTT